MAVIYGDDLANDLSGTAGADSIYGLGGDDTLTGYAGDSLYGGTQDDVYYVHRIIGGSSVFVYEDADSGVDTVYMDGAVRNGLVYIPPNVENIVLRNNVALAVVGNDADNEVRFEAYDSYFSGSASYVVARGFGGDDVLYGIDNLSGFDGDFLDGGSGIDGMVGGKGGDGYSVDNKDDIVIEYAGEGVDTVYCTADKYRLPNNVENLELYGDKVLSSRGNELANVITSYDDFSRIINARGGNDVVMCKGVADDLLIGGAGNDTLQAGLGNDVYRTSGDFGRDEITDIGGDDAVEFDVNESSLWFSKSGNDLNISVIGTQNGVTIRNWYSDSNAKIEEFYAGTGKMVTGDKVDALVAVMSGFAQPTTTALPANIQAALAPTLAVAWQ